jgi:fatty acid desaturase
MLKQTTPPGQPPEPGSERPVGELVHQLVEDGKAYARAELAVVKATASAKAGALTVPAILFGAAFLLIQAAVTVLAVAVYLSLLPLVGPFFAGLLAFLIFAGIAGGLGWYGAQHLRRDL